jgi:DNA polymerase III delta prime subunit
MALKQHLNQNNLHHAYLIEGKKEVNLPLVLEILSELKINISNNPDFYQLEIDSFKIKDAQNLKSLTSNKSFSNKEGSKKIFIISANSFLLEAQNSLLKVFEEPIENTHFFILTPSVSIFIPTLLSRFYVIREDIDEQSINKEVDTFLKSSKFQRIEFLKVLLKGPTKDDEEEDEEESLDIENTDSPKAKALKFLDSIELTLHKKFNAKSDTKSMKSIFDQIFKVRKYLRQPGSSVKSLMESVALSIPENKI